MAKRRDAAVGWVVLLGAAAYLACSDAEEPSGDAAVERGKTIYANVCTVCHNADPTQDGLLGPPLAGAPLALLEAKVLRGEYPPGYTPTRDTATMPQFAYLEPHLADVAAFLAQSGAPK